MESIKSRMKALKGSADALGLDEDLTVSSVFELKQILNLIRERKIEARREIDSSIDYTNLPTWGQGPKNTVDVFSWDYDLGENRLLLVADATGMWRVRPDYSVEG